MKATLEKPRVFGNLMTQVIRPNLCSFCGACMASCPIGVLWPQGEHPTLIGTCALCEICYYVCPTVEFSREDVECFLHGRARRHDEALGISRDVFVGRALKEDIRSYAQDGGIVTALLAYALQHGRIDAAVVAGKNPKWLARPVVATSYDDLVRNAGTKYTPSPTLMGVSSAMQEYGKEHVGVVGTPCQVKAVRRIQTSPMGNRRLASGIVLTIGLFCMESYSYDKLVENYLHSKGIDPEKVTRVAIKKGSFIVYVENQEALRVPLKELDAFVRESCSRCEDFTAEYSDISVGGVGCPDGFSTIIARTEKGLSLLRESERAGYLELRELPQTEKWHMKVVKMAEAKRLRKAVLKDS